MTTIQWRRDTAAAWTAANTILAEGEAGFETDTGKVKVGNGTTAWTSLAYLTAGAEVLSAKGQPNGYASLDTNGKVPGAQLPNSIMTYEGLHNVSTNTPALTNASGDAGQVYRVSVGGTRNYGSGNITLNVGDYLIHNGSVWEFADTTDAVSSINGYTGAVSLTKSDVGLGSVDNTSDATKNSAAATLTNKTLTDPAVSGVASVAQGGSVSLFNTADQTTNTEALRIRWSGNVAELGHLWTGTGSARTLRIGVGTSAGTTIGRFVDFASSSPFYNFRWGGTGNVGPLLGVGSGGSDTVTSSSAIQTIVGVTPVINQSGTGGYTGLLINPTESTTGSGTKRLIAAQVGGTDRFVVDNVGNVGAAGVISQGGVPVVTTTGAQSLENKTLVSPTLTAPVLGTPASGTLTNCTGLPVAGISATGTRNSTTYLSGDGTWATVSLTKTDVGLGNVDNTSNATERAATATLTNKTLSSPTFSGAITPDLTNVASAGYLGMPANSRSAAYTLVAADAGKMILHPSSDNAARTFTIPANSSVAYPVGTVVTFVNGVNTVTIGITSDTMKLAGAGTTGSRTLAANGIATAIKVGSTEWIISGVGLT